MSNISKRIQHSLESTDFIEQAFPCLTSWGVQDEDVFMHSIGCSVWNTLGHELGYMAVVEAPAPVAVGSDIRSDSAWFEKKTNKPLVLIEFERYDGTSYGKSKLSEKLDNLIEAASRWENMPELIVLSAWSKDLVSAPDISELFNKFKNGIKNKKGININSFSNCSFLFNRFICEPDVEGLLRLEKLMFWESP